MNLISRKTLFAFFGVSLALTPPHACAEHTFRSEKHHFRIAFPDVWSIIDRKAPGAVVSYGRSHQNSNGTISLTSCNIAVTDAPSTKGKRQEQINSEIEKLLNSGAMVKNYSDAGLIVKETYTRTIGGIRALVVIGNAIENVYGLEMPLVRQLSMFYTPGVGHVLTCQATPVEFPKESLLFDKVSDSFRFE